MVKQRGFKKILRSIVFRKFNLSTADTHGDVSFLYINCLVISGQILTARETSLRQEVFLVP